MAESDVDAGVGAGDAGAAGEVDPDEDPYGLGSVTGDEKKDEKKPDGMKPGGEPDAQQFDF
jgi:hypothetical protein